MLIRGYEQTSAMQTLRSYHSYLNDGTTLLPGEGYRILTFVFDVIKFINDLKDTNGTSSPADLIYSIVDRIILQKDAVMNDTVSGLSFFIKYSLCFVCAAANTRKKSWKWNYFAALLCNYTHYQHNNKRSMFIFFFH